MAVNLANNCISQWKLNDTGATTTVVDSVIALEVEGAYTGNVGSLAQFTNTATGGKTINVVSACTSVSDVLITGSGVKASDKAVLEVSGTGNTAAGGSILRVTNVGGTPAAATASFSDEDLSGD